MTSVELAIAQVVEQVPGAGDRAEGDEGQGGVEDLGGLVEAATEQEARVDEQVLNPLRGRRARSSTPGLGLVAPYGAVPTSPVMAGEG